MLFQRNLEPHLASKLVERGNCIVIYIIIQTKRKDHAIQELGDSTKTEKGTDLLLLLMVLFVAMVFVKVSHAKCTKASRK